jgi:hypothetical protein
MSKTKMSYFEDEDIKPWDCIFFSPEQNKRSAIPRHTEINNILAKKICKDLGVPAPKKK